MRKPKVTIELNKAITLQKDDGTTLHLPRGESKVDDDVASHWYVRGNLVGSDLPIPPVGTHEYAEMKRAEANLLAAKAKAAAQEADEALEAVEEAKQEEETVETVVRIKKDAKAALEHTKHAPRAALKTRG